MPLPERRQAVCGIHVDSRPLMAASDSIVRARRLHDTVASRSTVLPAYRDLTDACGRLLGGSLARSSAPPA